MNLLFNESTLSQQVADFALIGNVAPRRIISILETPVYPLLCLRPLFCDRRQTYYRRI
jgi:hypothetical protein